MRKLSAKERADILSELFKGNSIRATARELGVGKNTVLRLLAQLGMTCAEYQATHVFGLRARRIKLDTTWSFDFVSTKSANATKSLRDGVSHAWAWTAIDVDTKLLIAYYIGGRDAECAIWFIEDLKKRLLNRVQLTSDSDKAYLDNVETAFSVDVDYMQLIKTFDLPKYQDTRTHNGVRISNRMQNSRLTRPSNFAKKLEGHFCAIALFAMYYNFCQKHHALRMTPAMAAGVTKRLWSISDIVALLETEEVI